MRLMPFSQAWGDARSHAMVVNDDTAHLTPLSALGLIASRLVPTGVAAPGHRGYRALKSKTRRPDSRAFFPDTPNPLWEPACWR